MDGFAVYQAGKFSVLISESQTDMHFGNKPSQPQMLSQRILTESVKRRVYDAVQASGGEGRDHARKYLFRG